jgi:hypothetical protein
MTFGGRANPSNWINISESACNLVNTLQTLPNFQPEQYLHLIPAKIPTMTSLDAATPFKRGRHLSVDIEPNDCGKSDIYLNNNIGIAPDLRDNVRRLLIIMPLVICLLGRPLHNNEPIARKWLLSLSKFSAEGQPKEIKIVLGWQLNTRELLVSLPEYKHSVWTRQIQVTLDKKKATLAELENIKGRLMHLACVDRTARHFLGRINHMVTKLNRQKVNRTKQKFRLPPEVLSDLHLMLKFIDRARAGVSMNLLVHRSIDACLRTGACFFGLGWLCWCCGRAYRLEIPPEQWLTKPQNFVEFLGCCAALREDAPFGEDTCVCCQTDNTNAEGRLHKTNFYDDKEKIELARWLAEHQIKQKYCLYSQWFAGKANIVSDALSRDHHLSDHKLTSRLLSQHPVQLPKHFRIYPVSQETRSWVYSMLPTRHENMEPPPTPTRSPLGASAAGSNSPTASTSVPILTWRTLTKQPESKCWEPSANQSAKGTTPGAEMPITHCWDSPPKSMSNKWQRPLWRPTDQTLDSTDSATIQNFYKGNTKVTKTSTDQPNTKRRSPPPSSYECGNSPNRPKRNTSPA